MPAHVVSVNVVHALIHDETGDLDQTAIDKRPVDGCRAVRALGVEGDLQYDAKHHGGRDQAVYAYAREDLDWWAGELGRDLRDGKFGENLTTSGLDVTGAVIGETWQIGSDGLVLQVTAPRIPCLTFKGWMGEQRWVKRFAAHGASGAYLRVLRPGRVGAGDSIAVERPDHGVTIGEVFTPRSASEERLQRLLDEQDDLHPSLIAALQRDLAVRAS